MPSAQAQPLVEQGIEQHDASGLSRQTNQVAAGSRHRHRGHELGLFLANHGFASQEQESPRSLYVVNTAEEHTSKQVHCTACSLTSMLRRGGIIICCTARTSAPHGVQWHWQVGECMPART